MTITRSRRGWAVMAVTLSVLAIPSVPANAARRAHAPTVRSLSPAAGPTSGGRTITVHGSHFSSVTSVRVGKAKAGHVRVVSPSTLTAVLPKHAAGLVDIRVQTTHGKSPATARARFRYVARPVIGRVRLVKGSGTAGSTVAVTGTHLDGAAVRFGATAARVRSRSGNTVYVTVPSRSAGLVHLTASVSGVTSSTQPSDLYPMPTNAKQDWSVAGELDTTIGTLVAQSCPTADDCFVADASNTVYTVDDGALTDPVELDTANSYGSTPTALSCPSTTFCAASTRQGVFLVQNGVSSDTPSPTYDGGVVSCPQAGECLAVAPAAGRPGPDHGASIYENGTWTPVAAPPELGYAYNMTCFEAWDCILGAQGTDGVGEAFEFDGTSWTRLDGLDVGNGIESFSCASSTLCAASGSLGQVSVWDGSTWSSPVTVDPTPQTPDSFWMDGAGLHCAGEECVYDEDNGAFVYRGGVWTRALASHPYAIVGCQSIAAALKCRGEDHLGNVATFDGSSWSAPSDRLVRPGPAGEVDCVSASFCAMTDLNGNAYVYDGTTFSSPTALADTFYQPSGVSCVSSSFCLAVYSDGTTARWDGSGWIRASSPVHPMTSVSCASTTWCLAFGRSDVELFNGSRWHVVSPDMHLLAVSCPTTTFCGAVTAHASYTFDGTEWTLGAVDDDLLYVENQGISCPTVHMCLAIDNHGRQLSYDDGTWADPVPTLSNVQVAVSCSSATFCQTYGEIYGQTFDGRVWSGAYSAAMIQNTSGLSSLSCYGQNACVGAGVGELFRSNPAG